MIPKDMTTVSVKLNAEAFDYILSLADEQLKLKQHMLKNYSSSNEVFDRTIDSIHINSLLKEHEFYNTLIAGLKMSLHEKRKVNV